MKMIVSSTSSKLESSPGDHVEGLGRLDETGDALTELLRDVEAARHQPLLHPTHDLFEVLLVLRRLRREALDRAADDDGDATQDQQRHEDRGRHGQWRGNTFGLQPVEQRQGDHGQEQGHQERQNQAGCRLHARDDDHEAGRHQQGAGPFVASFFRIHGAIIHDRGRRAQTR
jgi:hypothetical protein